jgi:hypothetical protein
MKLVVQSEMLVVLQELKYPTNEPNFWLNIIVFSRNLHGIILLVQAIIWILL